MDLKNTETRIKMLPILALVFQVLSLIFLFIEGAIKKVHIYYYSTYTLEPSNVYSYKKSIQSAATDKFDLGGNPVVEYSGHSFWFYSFLILLIVSIIYIIFTMVKGNIISRKISALIIAGISLYGMIMAIVSGSMKTGVGKFGKIYYELKPIGYMFIVFCVIVIALKVIEFFLVYKQEKTEPINSSEE